LIKNKSLVVFVAVLCDYFAAAIAYGSFYYYRKIYIESSIFGYVPKLEFNEKFFLGLALIPFFWLLLYYLTGTYKNFYRKSRLKELTSTIGISILGVLILFFAILLDDTIFSYKTYYRLLFTLLIFHFSITYFFRFIISTMIVKAVHNRKIGFRTVMVGSNANAFNLLNEMENMPKSSGNQFVGFVHIENKNGSSHLIKQKLPHLGEVNEIDKIIKEHEIEEVIIAIESSEHEFLKKIISDLDGLKVVIKVIPDTYDLLTGMVKMNSIFGAPLIEISHDIMPQWQQTSKRLFDIVVSLLVLILFSPFYLITALIVITTSKGPAIYSHERIGLNGKPFKIYKFRSMYVDAEKNGPALSSKEDCRITPFGRFMRKVRLDEMPQFYNALIGEMSIVGPRPERQFFINQIVKQAPHYKHLHKVKPGITSWGQVKYGYAENVEQMIERLRYDLLYIENMSLMVDLKILIYTVLIVVQGRGK
jgi:exopolysaccharide biosynthesis polyprenyl glycosylphosphotransferase